MMRHLSTLVFTGVLGTLVMAGNAEACHKKRCACVAPVSCTPVVAVCPRPVPPPPPVVRCKPVVVKTCAPKVKHCGGGGLLARLCHKKTCAPPPCSTPVAYAYNYGTPVVPSGQYMAAPQK